MIIVWSSKEGHSVTKQALGFELDFLANAQTSNGPIKVSLEEGFTQVPSEFPVRTT
jgi:hypothetical protein